MIFHLPYVWNDSALIEKKTLNNKNIPSSPLFFPLYSLIGIIYLSIDLFMTIFVYDRQKKDNKKSDSNKETS